MIRNFTSIGLALSFIAAAEVIPAEVIPNENQQKVQVTNTQRQDFAPGGVLHLKNSVGNLTVEGWTRDYVEITTIKSTQAAYESGKSQAGEKILETVRVGVERKGDELLVTTEYPRPPRHAHFFHGGLAFDLQYEIKVPRDARLVVDQDAGEVNLQNLTNDIQVTVLHQGQVTVYLAPESQYAVSASAKFGGVTSNLPGQAKPSRLKLGESFNFQTTPAPHKLSLKVASGDILILTTPGLQASL